jgi:hypothetical protein
VKSRESSNRSYYDRVSTRYGFRRFHSSEGLLTIRKCLVNTDSQETVAGGAHGKNVIEVMQVNLNWLIHRPKSAEWISERMIIDDSFRIFFVSNFLLYSQCISYITNFKC